MVARDTAEVQDLRRELLQNNRTSPELFQNNGLHPSRAIPHIPLEIDLVKKDMPQESMTAGSAVAVEASNAAQEEIEMIVEGIMAVSETERGTNIEIEQETEIQIRGAVSGTVEPFLARTTGAQVMEDMFGRDEGSAAQLPCMTAIPWRR